MFFTFALSTYFLFFNPLEEIFKTSMMIYWSTTTTLNPMQVKYILLFSPSKYQEIPLIKHGKVFSNNFK